MAFKGTDFVPTVDTVGAEEDFWGLGSIAQTPLAEPEIAAQPTEINTETTQQSAMAASPEATMPTAEEIDSSDIAKEIAQQEDRLASLASLKQQQSALSATVMSVDGIQADAAKMGVNGGSAGDKIKAAAALNTNDPEALERAIGEADLDAGLLSQVEGDIEHKKLGKAVGGALETGAKIAFAAGAAGWALTESAGAAVLGGAKDTKGNDATKSGELASANEQGAAPPDLEQRIASLQSEQGGVKRVMEDADTLNIETMGVDHEHLNLQAGATAKEVEHAELTAATAKTLEARIGQNSLINGTPNGVDAVPGGGKQTVNVNELAGAKPTDPSVAALSDNALTASEDSQAQASAEKTNEIKERLGNALLGATVAASFLPGGAAAASLEAAMPGMRAAYASNFIERDATGGTTNNYAGLENKPAAGAEAMPGANNRYVVMNNSNNNMLGSLAPTSIGIGQEGQGIGKV